jgi:hypothetical protein
MADRDGKNQKLSLPDLIVVADYFSDNSGLPRRAFIWYMEGMRREPTKYTRLLLTSSQSRVDLSREMISRSTALIARCSRGRIRTSSRYLVAQDRQWADLRMWLDQDADRAIAR